MNKDKDLNKPIGTRKEIFLFIAVAISAPIFILSRYMQRGCFRWLDFVGAGGGVIIGFGVVLLTIYYVNRK